MLTGHNIIYLGPEVWKGLWRNRHWLMSGFAAQNQVLYVEPHRAFRRTLRDWRTGQVEMSPWRWRPLSHVAPHLYVYHPPPLAPVTGAPILRRVTASLRRQSLRRVVRELGMQQPIVWISRPGVADLASTLSARLTIYHVVDEYSTYPGKSEAERARLRAAEQPVLAAADLVIVTSQSLLEAKRRINPRTYLVPNAVNVAGYQQHLHLGAPLPDALSAIPRPRLGYVGLIGAKLDFTLLETVARARPDWSLVFVGTALSATASASWNRLRALPNVYHITEVPAEQVPAYVYGFDVGLMPYAQNEHARSIDPLKLYDYLAGGKPVVSAELPALEGYRHVVRVANTPARFVEAVEAALREDAGALVAERYRLAEANSWEHRLETISTLIEEAQLGRNEVSLSKPRRATLEVDPARPVV